MSDTYSEELIRDAVAYDDPSLSNCCGFPFFPEGDICRGCDEHASALLTGFQFPLPDKRTNPAEYRRAMQKIEDDGRPSFNIVYDPVSLEVLRVEKC